MWPASLVRLGHVIGAGNDIVSAAVWGGGVCFAPQPVRPINATKTTLCMERRPPAAVYSPAGGPMVAWVLTIALAAEPAEPSAADGTGGAGRPAGSARIAEAEAPGFVRVEPVQATDAPTVVLRGGVVMTAAGQRYERGWVVLKAGRVSAVGEGDPPAVDGAKV